MSNSYNQAAAVRSMCEVIAAKLGHTDPPDSIDPEPTSRYSDGIIYIVDAGHWLDLRYRAPGGVPQAALSIGRMAASIHDSNLAACLDHIRGLYIAALFLRSLPDQTVIGVN